MKPGESDVRQIGFSFPLVCDDRRGSASDLPRIPESITEDQVSREVKSELGGLPADLAIMVGRYLVAAELAMQTLLTQR